MKTIDSWRNAVANDHALSAESTSSGSMIDSPCHSTSCSALCPPINILEGVIHFVYSVEIHKFLHVLDCGIWPFYCNFKFYDALSEPGWQFSSLFSRLLLNILSLLVLRWLRVISTHIKIDSGYPWRLAFLIPIRIIGLS